MQYELSIEPKPTYLHVIVTGENTRANVAGYLDQLLRECDERQVFRVLLEERLTGPRLPIHEVFDIITHGSQRAFGKFQALAFIDANAEGHLMNFAETVAYNRALPMKVFASVAEAERWLTESVS